MRGRSIATPGSVSRRSWWYRARSSSARRNFSIALAGTSDAFWRRISSRASLMRPRFRCASISSKREVIFSEEYAIGPVGAGAGMTGSTGTVPVGELGDWGEGARGVGGGAGAAADSPGAMIFATSAKLRPESTIAQPKPIAMESRIVRKSFPGKPNGRRTTRVISPRLYQPARGRWTFRLHTDLDGFPFPGVPPIQSRSMDLSVVIVALNGRDMTLECLATIPGAAGGLACEIVLVDNGSSDSTAEAAGKIPGVRVIRNSDNRGYGPAANQGMRASTGKIIALVNNDTRLPPGSLKELAALLEADPKAAVVGPQLQHEDGRSQH